MFPTLCPLCSSERTARSRRFRDRLWPLWDCDECGLSFVFPTPSREILEEVYKKAPNGWEWKVDGPGTASYSTRVGSMRAVLERIEQLPISGKALIDVGCGHGPALEAGLAQGWDVTGIEVDEAAVEDIRRRLPAKVLKGEGVETLRRSRPTDLVVMSHWLEHITIPCAAMVAASALLGPGGAVLIRVPNADSRVARAGGVTWSWFTPPAHLHYYSAKTLATLASRTGFVVVACWSQGGDAHSLLVELFECFVRGLTRMARGVVLAGERQQSRALPTRLHYISQLLLGAVDRRLLKTWGIGRMRDAELVAILQKPLRA